MTPRQYIEKNLFIRTKDSKVIRLKLNRAQVRLYEALERQRKLYIHGQALRLQPRGMVRHDGVHGGV